MQDHCSRSPAGDEEVPGARRRVPVIVSRQHRDAIHTELLTALTRIGDVWLLAERGDHREAQRTSRDLRGVTWLLDDLGWDPETDGDEFAITMRPPELAAVIYMLQSQTAGLLTGEIEDVELARTLCGRSLHAIAAYGVVLTQIGEAVGAWGR